MAIKMWVGETTLYRVSHHIDEQEQLLLASGKTLSESLLGAAEEYAIECAILKVFGNKESIDKVSFKKTDLDLYIKELKTDLEEGEEMEHDVKIFHNALSFSEVIARDCMVPRNEIIALEINDNIEDLKNLFLESGHSRIIIYKDNIDNIIGYVHSIELFKIPISIKSMLIPLSIVPESMSGIKLLEDFIEKKRSVSVVVDEYGGTSGILTMEDIIEEIFGEIDDEHDEEEEASIRSLGNNTYQINALASVEDFDETFVCEFSNEGYDTVGGLLLAEFGRVPERGEDVVLAERFQFRVTSADNRRIIMLEMNDLNAE